MKNKHLKNLRNHLLLVVLLLSAVSLCAQEQAEKCATDIIHNKLMATNPEYAKRIKTNEFILQKAIANNESGDHTLTATFTVPVVVHVIHLGEAIGTGTNISNAQILSSISALTDAYRKAAGTPFDGNGVDTGIEFCLAQKDPSGNPSTGINRINGTGTGNYETIGVDDLNEVQVKALSFWDNEKYYNIWVVSEIDDNNGGQGTQGYAYYPPGGAFTEDGTVVLFNAFGYDPSGSLGYNLKSYTNMNSTMVHEMGHALDLFHTFKGDGSGSTCPPNTPGLCATEGDLVCDIPPHMRSQSNCVADGTVNSCSSGSTALDYQHNYMDYSSDACVNMFTAGQSTRTTATLTTLRGSLVTTSNLAACGCSGISVTIGLTSGSNPTCSGQSLTFTATPDNGGTSPTYQWYLNGAPVNLETGVTYTSTTLTNETVTCIMTSGSVTSNAIVISLTTGIVPAVSTAVTSGSNPTCAGASITFTATPTSGGTAPAYQWKVDGVNVGTNSATYTSTALTNGQTVTCVMTSNLSCASPTTATSNTTTIITSGGAIIPTVSTAITTGSTPACAGQSFTFTATPVNGGATPIYQWKVNGVNVGTNSTAYTTTALTDGQTVTCVMTSNEACASPSTVSSAGISITITSTPTINFIANKNVCGGDIGASSFSSTPSGATYTWTNSNTAIGLAANGTGNVPAFTAVNSTSLAITATITVTPSINNACTGIPSTYTITVNPTPIITQNGAVLSSSTASSYQWYRNGQPIVGATNQTYTPTQNGDFNIIVGGSTCPSDIINMNDTGINQINSDDFFTVYPNPNDGNFTVSFNAILKSTYKLSLLNTLGALVYLETLTDPIAIGFNGSYLKQMDITKYGKGIYLISISNQNMETVKKVIVY